MSNLQKKVQLSKLPPMPPAGMGLGGGKKGMMRWKRNFTPVSWDQYFESKEDVQVENNTFRVYLSGKEGPVCLFLHGGGFSGLSWAVLSKCLTSQVKCRCAAVDLRGHGDSVTTDDTDLSADTLAKDVGDTVQELFKEDMPPIILVGHSMGGAVAVHTALKELIPSLIGLVVIDVVEGTALEALTSMQSFLKGRPPIFRSLEHAIEWCVKTGQTRNVESAKVSMVGQLKRKETNATATSELQSENQSEEVAMATRNSNTIQEEEEEGDGNKNTQTSSQSPPSSTFPKPSDPASSSMPSSSDHHYTWRIDLGATEKFWRGWFEGLSQKFLSCNVPKVLLLAGVDRLDKDLSIGQMQGKFQMQVLPQCGHAVHEDAPDKVADVLSTFMLRHKVAEPAAEFQRTFPAC